MWTRFDTAVAIAKLAICIGGGVLAWQWQVALHRWAEARYYVHPYVPLYDALVAIGTLTAWLAILSLTRKNARRATINTLTILGATIVGMLFGDPQCRGRYDHRAIEGCLTFGILGALLGYAWTLLRGALRPPANTSAKSSDS